MFPSEATFPEAVPKALRLSFLIPHTIFRTINRVKKSYNGKTISLYLFGNFIKIQYLYRQTIYPDYHYEKGTYRQTD